MEAKDLQIPFSWKNRKPIVINRLLYVPDYYEEHEKFEKIEFFDNFNPIDVEYCSGNGQWIIEQAKKNPQKNFIAVEKKFKRARKIWVKMHNENLKNLFVVLSEAFIFTKYYLKKNFINEVYINFPDPWPKKRHFNKRLIQKEFVVLLNEIVQKNSQITIVTDHDGYKDHIIKTFFDSLLFESIYEKPFSVQDKQDFGLSFFSELFIKKGRKIHFLGFEKKESG